MKRQFRRLRSTKKQDLHHGRVIQLINNKDGTPKNINHGMFKQSRCWFWNMVETATSNPAVFTFNLKTYTDHNPCIQQVNNWKSKRLIVWSILLQHSKNGGTKQKKFNSFSYNQLWRIRVLLRCLIKRRKFRFRRSMNRLWRRYLTGIKFIFKSKFLNHCLLTLSLQSFTRLQQLNKRLHQMEKSYPQRTTG